MEQPDMDKPMDNDMEVISSEVKGLKEELEETKEKLTVVQRELAVSEESRNKTEKLNEELQEKVETLSQELLDIRGTLKKSVKDVGCQIEPIIDMTTSDVTSADRVVPSDWVMEEQTAGTSSQSVADSVKAAAEAVVNRSGFVLDTTSGMYYDCNSGYYYDQVNKLYYDPNSGTYYYYDERSCSYQFHSQVELPASFQATARQRNSGKGRGRGFEKKAGKRRVAETRDARRKDSVYDEDCEIVEMEQDTRHGQKRKRTGLLMDFDRRASESERVKSRRDRREVRLRKKHRSQSQEEVGGEVEVVKSRHGYNRRKQSRERRRKQRLEGHSRKKDKKSGDKGRRNKEDDHSYHGRQDELRVMEVLSEGEIGMDEGADEEVESRSQVRGEQEDGKPQSKKDQRSLENEKIKKTTRNANQKDGQDAQTSPETGRGSSEGSTAKDDSQSGEEVKTDEDKGQQAKGQGSAEQEGDSNHDVVVPNPETEAGEVEPPTETSLEIRSKGNEVEDDSYEEIGEDVMIIEDGEELIVLSSDELEEGELSDSESSGSDFSNTSSYESYSDISDDELEEIALDSDNSTGIEVLKVDYPPCIRMIVTKSDTIKPLGSLFIVTCSGGTIGREGSSHILLIPSVKVSKRHAQIVYESEERQYTIKDLGSQNGTLINGKAISEQRVVSEPHPLSHRDYITIGGTTIRLHIHAGDETCDECEPGQVQALIAMQHQNESGTASSSTKQDKEQQRKKELRQLKKKFNLSKDDFVNSDPALMNSAYRDRAGDRRRVVGSDNPYQPNDEPASVDRAINSSNLGHKLLSKMGWTEGQSLGKNDQGIKEPIKAVLHTKNAGLGSGLVQNIDQVPFISYRNEKWNRARKRFNLMNQPPQGAGNHRKPAPAWVQGGAEQIETSRKDPRANTGLGHGVVQLPLATQRQMQQDKSSEIVEIWDESMETTSDLTKDDDSGQTPPNEPVKQTDDGSLADKHEQSKLSIDNYEKLLLGTEEENLNNAVMGCSQTEVSSSDKFVKGKGGKLGRKELQKRSNSDTLAEAVAGSSEKDLTSNETVINPDSNDCHSKSIDQHIKNSENASQNASSVEKRAENEQNKEVEDNIGKTESLSQSGKDQSGKESDKVTIQMTSERAGSSNHKGKIALKWNKGGKEKLTSNLFAFEKSDSEDEAKEEGCSKSDNQQKSQSQGNQPPEKDGSSSTKQRSDRPTRWSKTKSSSGK